MKKALDSLGDEIKGAKCVIIHYECNEKYPLSWFGSANEILQEKRGKGAIKWGWSFDNSLEPTQTKLTLMFADDCDKAEQMLESFIKSRESCQSCDILGESSDNDYKKRAKEIILRSGKTSISYLQRTLCVGFNKAAGIIESLEKDEFLSAPNSEGKREILG